MARFSTDKDSPHGYVPDYLRIAEELGPAATVCEVGVYKGQSLDMWQELFPDGTVIGVDIDPDCRWPEGTVKIVAAQDDAGLGQIVHGHAPRGCDLIVEDASHAASLSAATFVQLWPLVKAGGYYVVEDWADPWLVPFGHWASAHPDDELVDWVPSLINALRTGAGSVTYTREGLVIIRREA